MNNHEKKGKVGGSVLFTVIVVMMELNDCASQKHKGNYTI